MSDCYVKRYKLVNTICFHFRLNTDIIFGNKHGIRTILVLTGISSLEEVRYYEKSPDDNHQIQIPDFYLECLGDLEKLIK